MGVIEFASPTVGGLMIVVGLLTTGAGLWHVWWSLVRTRHWTRIHGVVVEVEEESDDEGTVYRPTIAYDSGGSTRTFQSTFADSRVRQAGDLVDVLVSPCGKDAMWLNYGAIWAFALVFPLLGVGAIVMGFSVLRGEGPDDTPGAGEPSPAVERVVGE